MKFSITNFFSKCDQIYSFLQYYSTNFILKERTYLQKKKKKKTKKTQIIELNSNCSCFRKKIHCKDCNSKLFSPKVYKMTHHGKLEFQNIELPYENAIKFWMCNGYHKCDIDISETLER